MECIPHQGDYLSQICQVGSVTWGFPLGTRWKPVLQTFSASETFPGILKCGRCISLTNEGDVIFLLIFWGFFTCQFFCMPLEGLVLGDIPLFIYTVWNSYVTNTTIVWVLQFFLQDKSSLSYVVFPSLSHNVKKELLCLLGHKRKCLVAKCKLYISENKIY